MQISVYYDGLCHLCSREINHYRKQPGAANLRLVDITAAEFSAELEGVNPQRVHEVMHVKTADGQIVTGVDAFIEIWKSLPRYNWAARLAGRPGIYRVMELGYSLFAKVRPWLPRKKALCEQSPYCETRGVS